MTLNLSRTQSTRPSSARHAERGSALVWVLMVLGLSTAGALYLTDIVHGNLQLRDLVQTKEAADVGNLGNLGVLKSLFGYQNGPQNSRVNGFLPYLIPEPYLPFNAVPTRVLNANVRPASTAGLWSLTAPNSMQVVGWNAQRLTVAEAGSIFSGAALPAKTGPRAMTTNVTAVGFVVGANWLISAVDVDADASAVATQADNAGQTRGSKLRVRIPLPPPPPPQCTLSGPPGNSWVNPRDLNPTVISYNVLLQGYGVFSAVTSGGTLPCATPTPAAAYSMNNNGPAGVPVVNCTVSENRNALLAIAEPAGGRSNLYWYYHRDFNATASTPWGTNGTCTTRVYYRRAKPASCAWTANPYIVYKALPQPIGISTTFAAAAQIYNPSTSTAGGGAWIPGTASTFWDPLDDGYDNYTNVPAEVWNVYGEPNFCFTNIFVQRALTCRFHGVWQWVGACTGPYPPGPPINFWAYAQSFGYVTGGSNWECAANLYAGPGCGGALLFTRWVPGCFVPETLIRVADGGLRRIDELAAGDFVYNPIKRAPVRIRRMIRGGEAKDLVRYEAAGGLAVTVTTGHPVPTARGLIKAEQLNDLDWVLGGDGDYHPLTSLLSLAPAPDQIVWNIELDTEATDPMARMIEANGGLVTGDFILQGQVEGVPIPRAEEVAP